MVRIPVSRSHAKARPPKETQGDLLAQALSHNYQVVRGKELLYRDSAGDTQRIVADVALPQQKMIVEIRGKQDTRGIMHEILHERVAREQGWAICHLDEAEVRGDMEGAMYRVRTALERAGRSSSRR